MNAQTPYDRTITNWVDDIHKLAVTKGWWEEEREFGTLLMLCVSELAEALEEYRAGHDPTYIYHEPAEDGFIKPEGIPIELADTIIRIFDMCGYYGIDIERAIGTKVQHNINRAYRHGGKVV